jgi:CRP-like cAMP-binding protein
MDLSAEPLARVRVFADLDPTAIAQLQSHTRIRHYQTGEIVFHEGDRLSPCLHILSNGTLHIKKIASSGKESWVRTINSGEIFAAPAVFGDRVAPATVVAATDSQVLTIQRDALLETIRNTPEVALRILEDFNQRLQQLHKTVHGLISERAIVRLARFLLDCAAQEGTETTENGERLKATVPYYQMARSIGITYEECVRLVKSLSEAISYQRGGIIFIQNWETLEALAERES